jgi:hypothetical protein
MLKRRQPRGISGGGIVAAALPPPEIARDSRSQFRPPRVGGGDLWAHCRSRAKGTAIHV